MGCLGILPVCHGGIFCSEFTKLGLSNSTYAGIAAMRDNEIGRARIFQERLGDNSVKPGPCKYTFKEIVKNNPKTWLAFQVYIEISSMAFLTGMICQAEFNNSKSILMAISQTESRHNAWGLSEVLKTSLLTGPSDTVYPYANQILDGMNGFIVPGSCPSENPTWPSPRQSLPMMGFNPNTTTARPGSDIEFLFPKGKSDFGDKDYYAVFYHGLNNISVPYDPKQNRVKIPHEFGTDAGLIIANIADEPHAPTAESVVAGPLFLLEQPWQLAKSFSFANSL